MISRNQFIKTSLQFSAIAFLSPLRNGLFAQGQVMMADDLLQKLVLSNDKVVEQLLLSSSQGKLSIGRQVGFDVASLASAYCSPTSKYHDDAATVSALEASAALLLKYQSADGTLNFGNLESPPDTAFLLEPLCAGVYILSQNNSPALG